MTTHVLTGSKNDIAASIASFPGEIREVIVLVDEPANADKKTFATVEEFFAEMQPYMVEVGEFDDSREAIYTRQEGE